MLYRVADPSCHPVSLTDPVEPGLIYKQLRNSIIHSVRSRFLQIFKTSQLPNHQSQRADFLREWSPHTICHISCVPCHMSHVTCRVSPVTCLKKNIKNPKHFIVQKKLDKVVELVGRGSVINRAYPVQFLKEQVAQKGIQDFMFLVQNNLLLLVSLQRPNTVPPSDGSQLILDLLAKSVDKVNSRGGERKIVQEAGKGYKLSAKINGK